MQSQQPKPDGKITPKRGKLVIKPGAIVSVDSEPHQVIDFISTNTAVCKSLESGKSRPVSITDLTNHPDPSHDSQVMSQELVGLQSKEYDRAIARYEVIKPLLELNHISKADVQERAQETNTGVASIYRWLGRFKSLGVISSLMMKQRGWKTSRPRIDARVSEIIDKAIEDVYLTKRRSSINKVIREVEIQCRKAHLAPPHANSVRNRIKKITESTKLRRRGLVNRERNKFRPAGGTFPDANYPLAVIQIDHTPVDVIIVDDESRQPLGRPFLTLAIDVFSRCVTGYYIGIEAPNANSVAMCISHSILPKEAWLELHNIDASWEVRGFPAKIHVDNGADFRTETLRRACLEYDIQLEFRPVKEPQYGGHIERLLGSFMKKVHDLPGTTFSSTEQRQEYNSEKMAAMTIDELEEWLLVLITKTYHNERHSTLDMPPKTKWEGGLWGHGGSDGIGLPPIPVDPITLELDFMPLFERNIFKDGVRIEGVRYYSDVLNPWIGLVDESTKKSRKHVFRRDPRNISKIWFYDEQLKQYFELPYADQSLPTMTLWQYRHIKSELRKKGADATNMHEVAMAYEEMNQIVSTAEKKTKKARRLAQQAKRAQKNTTPATVYSLNVESTQNSNSLENKTDEAEELSLYDDLKPFVEI